MIFTCKPELEDILTSIYNAWEWALLNGHDKVSFQFEPVEQYSFLEEYRHIDGNYEKTQKVIRSIQKKISYSAYEFVYYVTLSAQPDMVRVIYDFLRIGFRVGPKVVNMYTEPAVMRMMEIKRNVSNEVMRFTEFMRFTSMDKMVYVGHIEPKCNVIYPVAVNFVDRMPSENWMIVDDNRKTAVIHPKNQKIFVRYLNDDEFEGLKITDSYKDEYSEMWKVFFNTIAIRERTNEQCQMNHFPLWTRKHITEFN